MPRIVHVVSTPGRIGGAERVVMALTRAASERGYDQLVLNPFADDPTRSAFAEAIEPARYEGYRCNNLVTVPGMRRWLRDRIKRSKPDIVHAHLFHAAVSVASLSGGSWARVLTHHHGEIFKVSRRLAYSWLDRRAVARFDRVVAVSQSVARYLTESYRCPSSRVTVIKNGWEGHPLPRSEEPVKTILSTGNLRPEKGHATLLSAMRRVRASVPDARLVLVGDGPLRQQLEDSAASMGVSDVVAFPGATADVWPYFSSAAVYVFPSHYESLGIAAMEAMAAGVPVVASNVGGIPELIDDDVNGMLVPPRDSDALADAVIELLTDERKAKELGESGRRQVADMKMDSMAAAYLELYESLRS